MRTLNLSRPGAVSLLALGVLLLCVGCALPPAPPPLPPASSAPGHRARTTPDAQAAQFVGDSTCARCHPREFNAHSVSNHARTLRPARRDRLPDGFPSAAGFTDRAAGVTYTMMEGAGGFTLTARSEKGEQSRPVDLALGSGKRAMTFISLLGPEGLVELRASCFPKRNEWFVTPGQQHPEADPVGKRHDRGRAQHCMGCHATVLPESRVAPEARFMGVGCESCHGAGQAHVAAASAREKDLRLEKLSERGGELINQLCGQCHRTVKDIDVDDGVSAFQTQRFQPYGLSKSACFRKSDDRLTCITCHSPHRNVETRPAVYERTCRSCHSKSPEHTTCPVNPRTGCVGCHMPRRALMPGISMADHFIGVYPPSGTDLHRGP